MRFPTLEIRFWLEAVQGDIIAELDDPDDFPYGYCADTCSIIFPDFRRLLKPWKPRIISGYFYCPNPMQDYNWGEHGHSWIEANDGTIIDPTAGQFFGGLYYRIFSPKHPKQFHYSEKRTGR